jgi:hypothetical protein
MLRLIKCHVVQGNIFRNRTIVISILLIQIINGLDRRQKIWAKITMPSDLALIKENAVIKNLLFSRLVLLRFNDRISASLYKHHSLQYSHLLLRFLLIMCTLALILELLIHNLVTANTLIVRLACYLFLFLLRSLCYSSYRWCRLV